MRNEISKYEDCSCSACSARCSGVNNAPHVTISVHQTSQIEWYAHSIPKAPVNLRYLRSSGVISLVSFGDVASRSLCQLDHRNQLHVLKAAARAPVQTQGIHDRGDAQARQIDVHSVPPLVYIMLTLAIIGAAMPAHDNGRAVAPSSG